MAIALERNIRIRGLNADYSNIRIKELIENMELSVFIGYYFSYIAVYRVYPSLVSWLPMNVEITSGVEDINVEMYLGM